MSDLLAGSVPSMTCRISLGFDATRAIFTSPVRPSKEMKSPSLTVCPPTRNCRRGFVDLERARAHDGRLPHLPADDGGVRRHAARRGEDPLRDEHAVNVVRAPSRGGPASTCLPCCVHSTA